MSGITHGRSGSTPEFTPDALSSAFPTMTTSNQDSFSRLMNWLSSQGPDRPEAPPEASSTDRQDLSNGRQDDPFSRLMNRISR